MGRRIVLENPVSDRMESCAGSLTRVYDASMKPGRRLARFSAPGLGNIGIHPRGMPSEWAWNGPGAIMLMRVPPALLQQAAETALRGALPRTELANCFSARDPFVERIVALFLAEIERAPHPAQAYVSQALSSAGAAPGAPLQLPAGAVGAGPARPEPAQPAAGEGFHRRPPGGGNRPADAGERCQCQPLSFRAAVPAQHRRQRHRLAGAGPHAARPGTDPGGAGCRWRRWRRWWVTPTRVISHGASGWRWG